MNFLPNISAPVYTLSAVGVGLLLIDDLSPAKQNSVGSWFMLIGQTICSNASQQQVINSSKNRSNISNQHIINDDVEISEQIELMKKTICALNKEIENLQK